MSFDKAIPLHHQDQTPLKQSIQAAGLEPAWQGLDSALQDMFNQHYLFTKNAFFRALRGERSRPFLPSEIVNFMQLTVLDKAVETAGFDKNEEQQISEHLLQQMQHGVKSLKALVSDNRDALYLKNGEDAMNLIRDKLTAMGLDADLHSIDPESAHFKGFLKKLDQPLDSYDSGHFLPSTPAKMRALIEGLKATCTAQDVDFDEHSAKILATLDPLETALDKADLDSLLPPALARVKEEKIARERLNPIEQSGAAEIRRNPLTGYEFKIYDFPTDLVKLVQAYSQSVLQLKRAQWGEIDVQDEEALQTQIAQLRSAIEPTLALMQECDEITHGFYGDRENDKNVITILPTGLTERLDPHDYTCAFMDNGVTREIQQEAYALALCMKLSSFNNLEGMLTALFSTTNGGTLVERISLLEGALCTRGWKGGIAAEIPDASASNRFIDEGLNQTGYKYHDLDEPRAAFRGKQQFDPVKTPHYVAADIHHRRRGVSALLDFYEPAQRALPEFNPLQAGIQSALDFGRAYKEKLATFDKFVERHPVNPELLGVDQPDHDHTLF